MIKLAPKAPDVLGEISAPPVADTFGTLDQRRDAKRVDGRTLRATGRTEQFANRITAEAIAAFEEAQQRAGMKKNELLEAMIHFWIAHHEGVPDEERKDGRHIPVTIYGNRDLRAGLEVLAKKRGASIHAVLEELVAVRIEQLRSAGLLAELGLKAKE